MLRLKEPSRLKIFYNNTLELAGFLGPNAKMEILIGAQTPIEGLGLTLVVKDRPY
jgi:hypothetical protein